jgi:hypothetical protein
MLTVLQEVPMSRRPIDERSGPATETLTLRLTPDDRALLDRLIDLRAAELADDGIEVTAASYVRGLIRRDAKVRGLLPEARDPQPRLAPAALASPVAVVKAPTADAIAPTDHEPPADRGARGGKAATPLDPVQVRADLVRALQGGVAQADVGRRSGIDSGQLSRFKMNKGGLSDDSLARLAAALKA